MILICSMNNEFISGDTTDDCSCYKVASVSLSCFQAIFIFPKFSLDIVKQLCKIF